MPQLPNELAGVLDLAVSQAKRAGNETVRAVHVAGALLKMDEQRYLQLFGEERVQAIRTLLRPSGAYVADLDAGPATTLLEAAVGADLDALVLDRVTEELARGPERATSPGSGDTPAAADADDAIAAAAHSTSSARPGTLPSGLQAVGQLLEPRTASEVVGRDEVLDQLVTALARRTPQVPVIVGPSGAGRTTVLQALADRLGAPDAAGPLAGTRVLRIDAAAVIARNRSQTLKTALQAARSLDGAIVALDDVELLTGLGWGQSVDMNSLAAIRSALDERGLRIVLVLDARFAATLEVHDRELAAELHRIELPALDDQQLVTIGRTAAAELSAHHRVEVPDAIVEHAAMPGPASSTLAHPALLVSRLDGACVRAALRGAQQVQAADLDLVTEFEQPEIASLERLLHEHIVGQQVPIERVTGRLALTRNQMDLRPERPDGVFLFVGPTGVGKTALGLVLSDALAGPNSQPIRLDMSEYAHDWSISRLIGPPPGYVGSTEPEQWLTTRVAANPDAVVILDEVEKAHPSVWNTFLQVFDAGRLTDSRGTEVDFSRTVIILTSNLGAAEATRPATGFITSASERSMATERMLEAVRVALPPELFNRLDDVVVFDPLSPTSIHEIARREVADTLTRLQGRGLSISLDEGVVDHLAETGYDLAYGARHLQRNIERLLLQPAARLDPGAYRVSVASDGLDFVPGG